MTTVLLSVAGTFLTPTHRKTNWQTFAAVESIPQVQGFLGTVGIIT
jgi:hypothetical protein